VQIQNKELEKELFRTKALLRLKESKNFVFESESNNNYSSKGDSNLNFLKLNTSYKNMEPNLENKQNKIFFNKIIRKSTMINNYKNIYEDFKQLNENNNLFKSQYICRSFNASSTPKFTSKSVSKRNDKWPIRSLLKSGQKFNKN